MYCGAVTVLHATHATRHLTQHEHHFLNDMGCMTWGDQPAFLAYSTFFNISAASGAKQKVQGAVPSFSTKKKLRQGDGERKRQERKGKERNAKEEEKGTKASERIEVNSAWKGSKNSCLALTSQGKTGIPSILHIYSFSTIDTPRAGKGQAKGHKACRPGPKRTETSRCYGVQHFREAFCGFPSWLGVQSRFNRDDILRP